MWAGIWLDEKSGLRPLFTVGLSLLGIVGAMVAVVYRVQSEEKDKT